MTRHPWFRRRRCLPALVSVVAIAAVLVAPASAWAGKLSWLDDVLKQVVREAEEGGGIAVKESGSIARASGRLLVGEADESLEAVAKRSEDLVRLGRSVGEPSEVLLQSRFSRLLKTDAQAARTFAALPAVQKRMVVEMGEAAQHLARRYPGQAETMIKALGTDGLAAVRVHGDDIAELVVKEGPETLGILRKTGRPGLEFFKTNVLPHKKKLAAAGVLSLFAADPDRFIDATGKATEYAVKLFASAGIKLVGAVSTAAARGLESSVGEFLSGYGLNYAAIRYAGMALAGFVVLGATMVLIGLPARLLLLPFRPFIGMFRRVRKVFVSS